MPVVPVFIVTVVLFVCAVVYGYVVTVENARLVALLRVTRAERDEARREAIPAALRARARRFIEDTGNGPHIPRCVS